MPWLAGSWHASIFVPLPNVICTISEEGIRVHQHDRQRQREGKLKHAAVGGSERRPRVRFSEAGHQRLAQGGGHDGVLTVPETGHVKPTLLLAVVSGAHAPPPEDVDATNDFRDVKALMHYPPRPSARIIRAVRFGWR